MRGCINFETVLYLLRKMFYDCRAFDRYPVCSLNCCSTLAILALPGLVRSRRFQRMRPDMLVQQQSRDASCRSVDQGARSCIDSSPTRVLLPALLVGFGLSSCPKSSPSCSFLGDALVLAGCGFTRARRGVCMCGRRRFHKPNGRRTRAGSFLARGSAGWSSARPEGVRLSLVGCCSSYNIRTVSSRKQLLPGCNSCGV